MSYTIDNKIVEMQFDNSNFEKNANTSIETLDRLKNSLSMEGLADGLGSVEQAIGNISFAGFENGINHVSNQFLVLQSIAFSVIQNITNDVLNFGKRVVNEFSLEPINQGFSEYEMKMNSVQTIMASTGESIETVDKYLEELNKYADDTIYSFADMTANIGKFTNSGVKLEDAVAAIKGISNEAALSGANANEASRAMYNFAQALSAGYVKLIDWKSIENANMATVEFKTQLLESAVAAGNLEKTTDGMYKVLTKNAQGSTMTEVISATQNFNDSLSYQWMTTNVLTKTLADYASTTTDIGIRANEAATKVKTFTQLVDTLKEASGSGWTETFQLIIGNLEEAKEFYTYLSDTFGEIINGQAKVRNDILKGWKEAGGRDAIIDALKYTVSSIKTLSNAIGSAFKEFFPSVTSEQLVKASEAIKSFAATINEFIVNNYTEFNDFFRGIFSVIDLFIDGLVKMASYISSLFGYIKIDPYVILDVADSFGIFLLQITELIRTTEPLKLFTSTMMKMFTEISSTGRIIPTISQCLGEFIGIIQKKLALPGFELLNSILNQIAYRVQHLGNITNTVLSAIKYISDAFVNSPIYTMLSKMWELAKKLGSMLSEAFIAIGKSIKSKLEVAEFRDFVDLFNTLMTSGVLAFLNKMSRNLSDFTGFKNIEMQLQELGFMFDNVVGDNLEKFQIYLSTLTGTVNAKSIFTIALSVAILAASLLALSLVDSEKLLSGLGAMTTLLGELVWAFKSVSDSKIIGTASTSLIKIAIAVAVLSLALKSLAMIDNVDNLGSALGAITALLGELVGISVIMGKKVDKMTSELTGLIFMAFSIKILSSALMKLSTLPYDQLGLGLGSVLALMAMLVVFIRETTGKDDLNKSALGFIAIGVALKILSSAVIAMGNLSLEQLGKGLFAVIVALSMVAVAIKACEDIDSIKSIGFAMVEIAIGIKVLAVALQAIGSLGINQIAKGLIGIVGALGGVLAFLYLLDTLDINNIISIGAGLLLISVAISILAGVLTILGGLSFNSLMIGLLTMAICLTGLAVALNFMKETVGASVALLIASTALIALSVALGLLSVIPFGSLIKSLQVLFVSLLGFALLASALAPLAPAILVIAASFALMGISVLTLGAGLVMVGAGLTSISAGLVAFAGMGAGVVASVIAIIGEILFAITGLIPQVIVIAITGMGDIARALIENVPTIIGAIVQIILSILDALIQVIPALVETVVGILVEVTNALLTALDEHIIEIVDKLVSIILKLCDTVIEHAPELIEAGVNIVLSLIQGLTQETTRLVDEGLKMIIAFINGLADAIEKNTPELINALDHLIDAAVGAVRQSVEWALPELADVGINIIAGIVNGIMGAASAIGEALISAASSAYDGVCDFLGIHSPSRLMRGVGRYSGKGLAIGITDEEKNVVNSALELAKGATTALGDELEKGGNSATSNFMDILSNLLGFDIDGEYQPTITPLFDLSNIQNGMGLLQSIFSSPQLVMAEANFGTPTRSNDYEGLGSLIDTSNREYADRIVNAIENLAGGISVEATIEGDMGRMFKIMKDENTKYRKSNGKGILD